MIRRMALTWTRASMRSAGSSRSRWRARVEIGTRAARDLGLTRQGLLEVLTGSRLPITVDLSTVQSIDGQRKGHVIRAARRRW